MKANEKAKELIDKYNKFDFNTVVNSTQRNYAKQCALIAVEEILSLYWNDVTGLAYWQEVKQEIINFN
jgi:hypothetical protein